MPNEFKKGDFNRICDMCGAKRKASQTRKTWDGFFVCSPSVVKGCWYVRNEQDFPPPVIIDNKPVPNPRPRTPDVYVEVPTVGYSWVWSTDPNIWSEYNITWSELYTTYNSWEGLVVQTWENEFGWTWSLT